MIFRRAVFVVFASFFLVRSSFAASDAASVMRIHWLGLSSVSADTNAAQFMKIWQLPQTKTLVAQTLDKLSRWPGCGDTNAASTSLRPLLDDLISSEFYLELSTSTNARLTTSNTQLFLAVRLSHDRARLWQTHLAAAAWKTAGTPHRIECSRAGGWTLVGVGLNQKISQTDFAAHFTRQHPRANATNWLEMDLNPSSLSAVFSTFNLRPSTSTHLHLVLFGDAGGVHASGTMDFFHPLETPLPPWEIPTNFIHAPLTSFTAVRGLAAWLAGWPAWQNLQLAPPPDQAFLWSEPGFPFLTSFAAPWPAASNQVSQLAGRLFRNANPWLLTNNANAYFEWRTNPPGLCLSMPFIFPYLKPVLVHRQDWLLGGLFPLAVGDDSLPPAKILHDVLGTTNLVYYHAEHIARRMDEDLFAIQMFQLIFKNARLSPATVLWLDQIKPLLGDSATVVTRTGPRQVAFARNSTTGLTALELILLADWLESPQFPCRLHTFLSPPDIQP